LEPLRDSDYSYNLPNSPLSPLRAHQARFRYVNQTESDTTADLTEAAARRALIDEIAQFARTTMMASTDEAVNAANARRWQIMNGLMSRIKQKSNDQRLRKEKIDAAETLLFQMLEQKMQEQHELWEKRRLAQYQQMNEERAMRRMIELERQSLREKSQYEQDLERQKLAHMKADIDREKEERRKQRFREQEKQWEQRAQLRAFREAEVENRRMKEEQHMLEERSEQEKLRIARERAREQVRFEKIERGIIMSIERSRKVAAIAESKLQRQEQETRQRFEQTQATTHCFLQKQALQKLLALEEEMKIKDIRNTRAVDVSLDTQQFRQLTERQRHERHVNPKTHKAPGTKQEFTFLPSLIGTRAHLQSAPNPNRLYM
jgi:hypothetical protein